ncbi:MAG: DUF2190 family protein [Nitrospirae bacterium]|nr:DUF2190 family protein [Nitrospirota bacterium]
MAKAVNKSTSESYRTRRMTHTAAVESHEIVVVNGQVVVAFKGADADAEGIYITDAEIMQFPKKAALAVDPGDKVYWDADPGEITKTALDGVLCGLCHSAAAADDTTVDVEFMAAAALQ